VNTTTSRLQPALIGGLVTGVLSALPFIGAFNACCCLWIVTGGVTAAYLLQDREPNAIQVGDGALVGLMAGVIGAFVYLIVSIPVTLLMAPMMSAFTDRIVNEGNFPPEVREMLTSGIGTAAGIILGFFAYLAAGMVFSTLGGILGTLIFRKPARPPVIDVPPSEM
jgi:uncharacterized protein YqgC (DUF456 family)